jgi:hypothetical protein
MGSPSSIPQSRKLCKSRREKKKGTSEKGTLGQMFAFLDDIQERIGTLSLKVVFDIGQEVYVKDLQVFPSTGDVCFRLAEVLTPSGSG